MIFENSRYLQTGMSQRPNFGETYVFNLRKRPTFNEENYTLYEWTAGDTLESVAYNFYEDPKFRWVLLDANPKYRTEFDIKNGDIINIPDYEEVVSLVNVEEE